MINRIVSANTCLIVLISDCNDLAKTFNSGVSFKGVSEVRISDVLASKAARSVLYLTSLKVANFALAWVLFPLASLASILALSLRVFLYRLIIPYRKRLSMAWALVLLVSSFWFRRSSLTSLLVSILVLIFSFFNSDRKLRKLPKIA